MPSRESFLPFAPPDIGDEEVAEVVECLRSGWITTGPRATRFEEEFATYVGAEAALALNSGTGALHTALAAQEIGAGTSVVVPTMTFTSVAHTVEHVGARPLLVDCERDTLNMDLQAAEKALQDPSVAGIAPVHLYGQPCNMTWLIELTDRAQVAIVDDAAHALPAALGSKRVGGWNQPRVLTAFSFYATKNLTTGEGGMLTGSRDLIEQARPWTLHGMSRDAWRRYDDVGAWRYDVLAPGFKYNMPDIQAALGLVQLRRLDAMHARRREIAQRYTRGLSSVEEIELPMERSGTTHAWHIYAIRLHTDRLTIDRDRFISELNQRKIGTSVHFIPLHLLSYYRDKYGYKPEDFPIATREFERLISLPIHTRMSDEDIDDVIEAVAELAKLHKR